MLVKGQNVTAPVVPNTTDDVYATHLALYGQGGLRTVQTLDERDAITSERRDWLMEVNVLSDGKKYTLKPSLSSLNLADNGNWALVVAGAGPAVTPWQQGAQTANSLVLYNGLIYLVKQDIANSMASPDTNTQYYLPITVDLSKVALLNAANTFTQTQVVTDAQNNFTSISSTDIGASSPAGTSNLNANGFTYGSSEGGGGMSRAGYTTLVHAESEYGNVQMVLDTQTQTVDLTGAAHVTLPTPINAADAATKNYVDNVVAGAGPVVVQDFSSNSTTSVPSVAAVVAGAVNLQNQIDSERVRMDTLVNGAPAALDTLKEIADQLAADEQGTAAILATQQQHTQQLAGKADKTYVDAADAALSAKIASSTGILFYPSQGDFPGISRVDTSKLYYSYDNNILFFATKTTSTNASGITSTYLDYTQANQQAVFQDLDHYYPGAVSQGAVKRALDAITAAAVTKAYVDAGDAAIQGQVTTIKSVVPATASSSNQLVVSNDSRLQDLARGFVDFQNEGEIYEESYVSNGGIFTTNFPLKTGYAFRLNRHANTVGPFVDINLPNPGYSGSYVLALRIPAFVTSTQSITSAKVFNNTNQLLTTLVPGATVIVRGQFGGWSVLFSTSPADVNKAYVDAGDQALQAQLGNVVHLTGNESIAGNKIFTNKTGFQGAGATTAAGGLTAVFGSVENTPAPGENFYTIAINKSGVEAYFLGINKNSDTGQVPANAAFFSSYTSGGSLSFGRGDGAGNPSTSDLFISSTGAVGVGTSSPSQRLEVAGNVKAGQFIGDGSLLTGLPGSPKLVKVYLDGVDNAIYYNLSDGSQISQSLNDYAQYFRGFYPFTDQSEIDNAPATPINYTTPLAPALAQLQKQITAQQIDDSNYAKLNQQNTFTQPIAVTDGVDGAYILKNSIFAGKSGKSISLTPTRLEFGFPYTAVAVDAVTDTDGSIGMHLTAAFVRVQHLPASEFDVATKGYVDSQLGGAGTAPVYRGAYFDLIQAEFTANPQPSISWNLGDVVSVDINFQSNGNKGQSTLFKCIQSYVDNDPNSVQRPDTSPAYWEVLLGPSTSSPAPGGGTGTPTLIHTADPYAVEDDGEQYIYLPSDVDGVISILVSEAQVNGFSGVRQLYPTDYSAGGNRVIISAEANLLSGDEVSIVYYTNGSGGSGGGGATPATSSTLEFVFNSGFADDFTSTIGTNQAGTYSAPATSNVDTVTYTINGASAALPLTLAMGDTFQVVITRSQPNLGAVVTLTT